MQGRARSKHCAIFHSEIIRESATLYLFSEAEQAIADGAREIDMVINVGALKSRNYALVFDDIYSVVVASSPHIVKVILETFLLSDEEKIAASYIAAEAGARFVKTCTGFLGGGANKKDVALMRKSVSYKGGDVKVKASAGVRSFGTCLEVLAAGAERIGTWVSSFRHIGMIMILPQIVWCRYYGESCG